MKHRTIWRATGLALTTIAVASVGATAAQGKANPETKRFPPTAHTGYFLGAPSPTYSWHGCTATAAAASLAEVEKPTPGIRPDPRGTKQSAVTFTRTVGAPHLAWKAKPGWTICGVQAAVHLTHPDVRATLVATAGYPSGTKNGATATDGKETLSVPIPKKRKYEFDGEPLFEQFRGKVTTIDQVRVVTVFVRRTAKR